MTLRFEELTAGPPNFDCMTSSDLHSFLDLMTSNGVRAVARRIFPDRRSRYCTVVNQYYWYARNVLSARAYRERGDIVTAQHIEMQLNGVFQRLPAWARW
jgi:hypothetical protein